MALDELLDIVGRTSGKSFIIDARAPARIVVGLLESCEVTDPLAATCSVSNQSADLVDELDDNYEERSR